MHPPRAASPTPAPGTHLPAFFLVAFGLAWAVWIPAGLLFPDAAALAVVGAWAPTVAALALAARAEGRAGVRALLRGLLRWRVGARYWAFAVLGVLGAGALAAGAASLLAGAAWDAGAVAARFGLPADSPWLFVAASPLVYLTTVFVGGPIAEELGWRGYAQPRLGAILGAGPAGVAIGVVWSLWHLPLFVFFGAAVGGMPLALYIPMVTALGVLFAWLYERTGGSVLLCILLHASVNFTLGILGGAPAAAATSTLGIFTGLLALLALVLFLRLRAHSAAPAVPAGVREAR